MTDITQTCLFRIKWSYTRNPIIYILFVICFAIKFNNEVQSIFYNPVYQTQYPSIINSSNKLPYMWDDQYWEELSYKKKVVLKKAKIYGDIDDRTLEIYNNFSISYPKLMNYYVCASSPTFSLFVGNVNYPQHHQWFNKRNINIGSFYMRNHEVLDVAIALPYSDQLSLPFYIMNVYSLLFGLNNTMLQQYPIFIGKKFDFIDEIINLSQFNSSNIVYPKCYSNEIVRCSQTIYVNNAFMVSVTDPYEVAYEPILRMVEVMKPSIKNSTIDYNKPIIVALEGDKRIIGKQKLFEHLNNTFEDQVDEVLFEQDNENETFAELASKFIYAKIAIGFSSEYMSLIPFMEPGSIFIEIQTSSTISRNVLLAQSFGIESHVFSLKQNNVSDVIIKNITKIIKKHIRS